MKKFLLVTLMLIITSISVYGNSLKDESVRTGEKSETTDLLALLPDSDIVLVMDYQKFINSKTYSELMDLYRMMLSKSFAADPKLKGQIDQMMIENMNSYLNLLLRDAAMGMSLSGKVIFISNGSADSETIISSFTHSNEKATIERKEYNGRTIHLITIKRSEEMERLQSSVGKDNPFAALYEGIALTFLSSGRFAFGDLESVKGVIDIEAGKKPGLMEKNQQLNTYISNLNADAALRFVIVDFGKMIAEMNAKIRKQVELANKEAKKDAENDPDSDQNSAGQSTVERTFESIKGIYGSLDLDSGFKLDLNMEIKTEAGASEMAGSLSGALLVGKQALAGQAKKDPRQAKLLEIVNQTKVEGLGKNVKIGIDLNQQLTDDILDMAKDSFNK
jgi:hypothetical protein